MIRFGAVVSVVAVAIGLLVAGAVSGTLALVYVSIGLAALALLMLIAGVAIWRDNVFGRAAAGDVRTTSGQPAGTFESEVVGSAAGSWSDGPSRVQPAEERQLAREYARGRTATFTWSADTLSSADEHGSPPPVGRGERAPSMSDPVFEPAAGRTARDRPPVVNRPVVNEPAAERDLREPDRPLTTLAGTGRGQAQRPGADRPGADRPRADRPSADRPGADRPSADRPGADRSRQASTAQRWLATDPAVPVTGREPARQAAESATVATNDASTTPARPAEASATAAADRAPADRAPADRAPADRATADRATADRAAAEPAAAEVAGGSGSVDQLADSAQVSVVPGIARYHMADCILIRFLREEDLETMTRHEAEAAGNVPCKACKPDKVAADG